MEKESRYETTVKRLIGHNLNAEEKVQLYNDWSPTFETNNKQFDYTGNSKCCEVVCKYFPKNIEHIVMLDVGAGTGLLAKELACKGFKIIDGLDPSSGMLKEAEKKNLYRNLFCTYFTSKPLLFSNPGGIICIVNRRSPFCESPDYVNKFFPLCDQLEQEGKWKKEEITTFNGFIENADRIIIVYRVR
ncbi:unnamed protein product [Mytilus edulis]|uniref:Methyltransferase domain-containing protein n=1 Tax=Mytilus edulis TaxID=6550 RepID=A0A8S3TG66_MYTED|nr:unnamed protein product [Mytilus edulis]